jgi:hypothetical protein
VEGDAVVAVAIEGERDAVEGLAVARRQGGGDLAEQRVTGAVVGQRGNHAWRVDHALVHPPTVGPPARPALERVEQRVLAADPSRHQLDPGAAGERPPTGPGKGAIEGGAAAAEEPKLADDRGHGSGSYATRIAAPASLSSV